MNTPRMYCKSCDTFKQVDLGRRKGNEWVCVSCFKKIEEVNGKNKRQHTS